MKKNISKKHLLRALQTAALVYGSINASQAAPVNSPEFTVNGSTVTGNGTNTNSAYFLSSSDSSYQVTINKGANLGNPMGQVIAISQGSVVNNGTLSTTNSFSQGFIINTLAGGTIINNGALFCTGVTGAGLSSDISVSNVYSASNITNNGSIVCNAAAGAGEAIYVVNSIASVSNVINNGSIVSSGAVSDAVTILNTSSIANITNNGSIMGNSASILVSNTNGISSIINKGSIIDGGGGIAITVANQGGFDSSSIVNSGSIVSIGGTSATANTGISVGNTAGASCNSTIMNTGAISVVSGAGLATAVSDSNGSTSNLYSTLTNVFSNSGTIQVTDSASSAPAAVGAVGILISQTGGQGNIAFSNSGTLTTQSSYSGIPGTTTALAFGAITTQTVSGPGSINFSNSGSISSSASATSAGATVDTTAMFQIGGAGCLGLTLSNKGNITGSAFSGNNSASTAGALLLQVDASSLLTPGSSASSATTSLSIANAGSISATAGGSGQTTTALGVEAIQANVNTGAQTFQLSNNGSISAVSTEFGGATPGLSESVGFTLLQFSAGSSTFSLSNSGNISALATNSQSNGTGSIASGVVVIGGLSTVSQPGVPLLSSIGSFTNTLNAVGSVSGITTLGNLGTVINGLAGAGTENVTLNNSGSIKAKSNNSSSGYSLATGVLVVSPSVTITNTGVISGLASGSQASGFGILLASPIANGGATINSTGTIVGSTDGIVSTGGTTDLNLDGGVVTGQSSYAGIIQTGTVNIKARTQLNTGANYALLSSGATGTLNLDLVGGTPGEIQQAEAAVKNNSGSFVFGGYTYSWQNFNTNLVELISLEQVCAPQYSDLAQKIDNNALPLGYDPFYDAALVNPNGALNELSGFTIIEGMKDLAINSQNSFLSTTETQLENLQGQGGFSTANLTIGNSTIPGVNSANSELDRLTTYADATRLNANTSNSTDSKGMVDTKNMAPTLFQEKWTVWLAGDVTLAHEEGLTGAPGYNAVNGSPLVGFDYSITPDLKTGFMAGATLDGANFGDGSKIDASTELVALYATYNHGPWFVNGLVGGGPSQYENGRPTFGGTAHSDPSGYSFVTQSTMGYTIPISRNFSATPEVGLQYTHLGVDSYSETGAGIFNTNVASNDIDSFRTHLGGKLDGSFQLWKDFTVIPEVRAAWYHEYLDDSQGVATSLAGAPAFGSFNVNTVTTQRDYALAGVGLSSIFTGYPNMPVGLFVNYDVQVGQSNYIQHDITGGVKISF